MKGRSHESVAFFDVGVGFLICFAVLAVPFIKLPWGGKQQTRLHRRSSERATKSGRNGDIDLILNLIGGRRT